MVVVATARSADDVDEAIALFRLAYESDQRLPWARFPAFEENQVVQRHRCRLEGTV
jgi:hypothetical protein